MFVIGGVDEHTGFRLHAEPQAALRMGQVAGDNLHIEHLPPLFADDAEVLAPLGHAHVHLGERGEHQPAQRVL